ncbi:MAG: hypothetical protein PHQ76_00050 [Caldisericia bacterium]|nr:hypothetical protein [Caldisericia bacterium]
MTIQELKNEAVKSEVKVSDLLREAKLVLKDSGKQELLAWIKKEGNGYSKGDRVPKYRLICGEPKGWNPYRGWIPFIHNNPKIQELLSKQYVIQSVAELEILISNKDESTNLQIPYSAEMQAKFSKSVGLDTKFSLFISLNIIYGILNTVRNKLIDWLIEVDTKQDMVATDTIGKKIIFPKELIEKLPKDLKVLADDFNFNFGNEQSVAGMLILRRMLPLSIVRKFQKLEREIEIKDSNGDYFDTKALLGKVESLLSNKRIYSELMSYKILIDSSQHSYTLNVQIPDTEGAAVKLRVFLDDIF